MPFSLLKILNLPILVPANISENNLLKMYLTSCNLALLADCGSHLLAKIAEVWSIPADMNYGSSYMVPHNGIPLCAFPKARKLHITS